MAVSQRFVRPKQSPATLVEEPRRLPIAQAYVINVDHTRKLAYKLRVAPRSFPVLSLRSARHYDSFVSRRALSGAAAWSERDWVGHQLQVGGAVLQVTKPVTRCAATQVNPETAERDVDPLEELRRIYGHVELGVHAEVIEGGRFAVGDAIEVLPE